MTEYLLAGVIASTLTVALGVLLLYFRERRTASYDEKLRRVELDMLRSSLEQQIYRLTNDLVSNERRWQDVNHLVISRLNTQPQDVDITTRAPLTHFLRSYGITEDQLTIDPKLVFVLTPFNKQFQSAFRAIAEACRDLNLECVRGDEVQIKGDLLPHILRLIATARVVIANIDGRNPNVFYELGIAHAMDKSTILVTSSIKNVPIDLRSKKLVVYDETSDLQLGVHKELSRIFVESESSGPNLLSPSPPSIQKQS